MGRFAWSGTKNVIRPRLDAIGPQRRLDVNAPIIAAYLEGRPVILARPDPRTRRPGMPANLTVPLTVSRFRRALDIEGGRDAGTYVPSFIDGWPLEHTPILQQYSGLGQDNGDRAWMMQVFFLGAAMYGGYRLVKAIA